MQDQPSTADGVGSPPAPSSAAAPARVGGKLRQRLTDYLARRVARGGNWGLVVWLVVLTLWLLFAGSLVLVWFVEREIWFWAIAQPIRLLIAWFAMVIALYLPGGVLLLAIEATGTAVDATFTGDALSVEDARRQLLKTEAEAIERLESTDDAKLLPLLRYSRAQLFEYYTMGLKQTRRSYVNAVIAMWLGFAILIGGVLLYIGPVEQIGLRRPEADFKLLILASGSIVEFIAALFLWVYRSTTGQLTFYYRQQMQSHTAILSFRMASTMERPDQAKKIIVEKMLASTLQPERPAVIRGSGLAALVPGAGLKPTDS